LVSLKSCDCYPDQSEETKDKKDKRRVDLLVDFIKERDEVLQGLRRKSSKSLVVLMNDENIRKWFNFINFVFILEDTRTFIDILPGSIVPGKVCS
jgi:hypothetical protein